jgi:hypothetical protein
LHNNVIFPDFSAFQMTIAGAAARVAPDHPEGSAEKGPADAWPNFSTPPERQQ